MVVWKGCVHVRVTVESRTCRPANHLVETRGLLVCTSFFFAFSHHLSPEYENVNASTR